MLGAQQNQDPKTHNGMVMGWPQKDNISHGSLEGLSHRDCWLASNIQSTLLW